MSKHNVPYSEAQLFCRYCKEPCDIRPWQYFSPSVGDADGFHSECCMEDIVDEEGKPWSDDELTPLYREQQQERSDIARGI